MKFLPSLLSLLLSLSLHAEFVVHEWGSINLVTGQQKVTVGDIADDQSDLPPFVQVWSPQAQVFPRVIEKPILYFYTEEPLTVSVTADYPEGVFTQWWPTPLDFAPRHIEGGGQRPTRGGRLTWRIRLDPKGEADQHLPAMKNHPWWPIARDVDAATVISTAKGGAEKFLFYRGAGAFTPTLKVEVSEEGEFLLRNREGAQTRDVYTVRVRDGGDAQFHYYADLSSDPVSFQDAAEITTHMQSRLEANGLFEKEAKGMVTIWKKAMFEAPGYRAMYIMEKEDVENLIPLRIEPPPKTIERVFLIRFDCLSPEVKSEIEGWMMQLGADGYRERRAAKEKLLETGRIGEAMMRTEYETTKDPEVKKSLGEILKAITPQNPNR